MIDIHSHILYGVDDGAKTIDESIAIIRECYSQGVRAIIATPHRRKNMFETPNDLILERFAIVQAQAKRIFADLSIYLGAEIYYTADVVEKLQKRQYWTLAQGDCALLEFSNHTAYSVICSAVNDIIMIGLKPVIAHIERYHCLAMKKNKVSELIEMGSLVQVNASNVLPVKLMGDALKDYKKRVRYLLKEDLVHFVASDVHNMTSRKCQMAAAYRQISRKYGADRAEKLFVDNPSRILQERG